MPTFPWPTEGRPYVLRFGNAGLVVLLPPAIQGRHIWDDLIHINTTSHGPRVQASYDDVTKMLMLICPDPPGPGHDRRGDALSETLVDLFNEIFRNHRILVDIAGALNAAR